MRIIINNKALTLSAAGNFAPAPERSVPAVFQLWRRVFWLLACAFLTSCSTVAPTPQAPVQEVGKEVGKVASPAIPSSPQDSAGPGPSTKPVDSAAGATSPGAAQPQLQPQPQLRERRQARIGLALGGGAARGFAHVGVIQVLEEAGLRPNLVVGTSAGSLVAALYASGKSPQELRRVAETMEEAEITDWMMPILNRGALRGEALARYVNTQVGGKHIEQMKIPLGIVATDLKSGNAVTFRLGNTGSAVRASSAVPAVFQPVRIGEREYVDGGLVAPVPVHQAREMGANFVIAVDISSDPESNPSSDTFQILMQTFTIMGKSINSLALKDAEFVVRPPLAGFKSADFSVRRRSIEAGRAAMQAQLPQLRSRISAFEAGP